MTYALRITSLSLAIMAGLVTEASAEKGHGGKMQPMRQSFEELDTNGDGQITAAEMQVRRAERFAAVDLDGDGTLSAEELVSHWRERKAERAEKFAARMIERYDTDGDGALSAKEMQQRAGQKKGGIFKRADGNGDGVITAREFAEMEARRAEHHRKSSGQGTEEPAEQ